MLIQDDRSYLYKTSTTKESDIVQPRSTFPISKHKLEVLLDLPYNPSSLIMGTSSFGYLSLELFLLKAIESPEHVPIRFKLSYKDIDISLYEGINLKVINDIFNFNNLGISNQCSVFSSLIGLISIPVPQINYIEILSYHWKPSI